MINSPCLNCKQRKLHCHSNCNSYEEYNVKQRQLKDSRFDLHDRYVAEKVNRLNCGGISAGRSRTYSNVGIYI
jgi:hypothetical protein